MLKSYKYSKSKHAGSQQVCQLRAATYKMTISASEGEQAENCWRLGEYFCDVSLRACSNADFKASLIGCFWRQDA